MLLEVYTRLLRLPAFKGKSWLTSSYRKAFFPSKIYRWKEGIVFDIDPMEWNQSDLVRDGGIEPLTCQLMGRILQLGDTYVDVGAHFGFHTLVARRSIGAQGRVIAIEPQPYNCHKLLVNWRANNFENLVLYVAAVGDYDGTVALHLQSPTDTSRLSLCLDAPNDQPQTFYVPMNRLDKILESSKLDTVRLLKVDIEGFELEALRGMGRYIDSVENIILEVLDTDAVLTEKSRLLLEELGGLGFTLSTVTEKPWSEGLDPLPENNLWAARI